MSYLKNKLVLGGSFMVLAACGTFYSGRIKEKLTDENYQVRVEILECYKTRKTYWVKLRFGEKVFSKRTDSQFCLEHKGQEEVVMLTDREQETFIFPKEFSRSNPYFAGALICILGLYIIRRGVQEERRGKEMLQGSFKKKI